MAEGSLWVDGKRIYEVRKMGMRVVDGGPTGLVHKEDDELEPARPASRPPTTSTDVAVV